jgi:hypothetical protein
VSRFFWGYVGSEASKKVINLTLSGLFYLGKALRAHGLHALLLNPETALLLSPQPGNGIATQSGNGIATQPGNGIATQSGNRIVKPHYC